jgi:hypothetical protein
VHHLREGWPELHGYYQQLVAQVYRKVHHYTEVELPRFSVDRVTDGLNVRVRYLLGEVTMARWRQYLFRREKRLEKNVDMTNLINLFLTVVRDMLRRLSIRLLTLQRQQFPATPTCPVVHFFVEYSAFQEYINEQKAVYKTIYSGIFPF